MVVANQIGGPKMVWSKMIVVALVTRGLDEWMDINWADILHADANSGKLRIKLSKKLQMKVK